MKESESRYLIAQKVTYVGMAVNIVLTVFKFIAGFWGNSMAMVADAVHSLSDFASDIAVIFGFKAVRKPADKCHQYGHGKIETFVTLLISLLLFLVGIGIFRQSVYSFLDILHHQGRHQPKLFALIMAFISIVSKEWLFRYTKKRGEQINSPAVIANAWHHRSDALSSIAAFLGIGGVMLLGQSWAMLDPIAAFLVCLMIVKAAWDIGFQSYNELMETAIDADKQKRIKDIAQSVAGAYNPHHLRSRMVGANIACELHIDVQSTLSVAKAHEIATEVENRLIGEFGESTMVSVHIEPLEKK